MPKVPARLLRRKAAIFQLASQRERRSRSASSRAPLAKVWRRSSAAAGSPPTAAERYRSRGPLSNDIPQPCHRMVKFPFYGRHLMLIWRHDGAEEDRRFVARFREKSGCERRAGGRRSEERRVGKE